MGKARFRFLLGKLKRIENSSIATDEKIKVINSEKQEILKWS